MNIIDNMRSGTRKKLEKGEKRDDGSRWYYMKKRKTGNTNMRKCGSSMCEQLKLYYIVECCISAHLHMLAL